MAQPPSGFELVESKLIDFQNKLRDVEAAPHEGLRRCETLWPIHNLNWERTRFVFEEFKAKRINRQVVDYCFANALIDKVLFAKWKKPGFERLCCIQCMQTASHNFQTACICRVPPKDLDSSKPIKCVHCGCSGCSS
ncbi:hypothetical protein RCL1_003297 [Eukaryota sp. TZLM3-RCL]